MIADTERIIDGFRGLPAGMDGSKDPPLTPPDAAYYATNVTFRGGNGPRTRPGFWQIPDTYWRNPQPQRGNDSVIGDGTKVTVTTAANHGYSTGDWVTVFGADAGFNGTYKITVTGATTFTYASTQSGTSTADGGSIRDEDNSYSEDIDVSGTSRSRYSTFIESGAYLQGIQVYQDPREDNPSQVVVVIDGWILALDFNERSCKRLNPNGIDRLDASLPVYMTQAERYIIIQNGKEEPRIFDGYALFRASYFGSNPVPVGKQMAYGQGRLFVVVNEGTEIIAGDIVFGGSTTNVAITISSSANPVVITTSTPHGFAVNDLVTIQGHSSEPWINSTYAVKTVPTTTTFSVPKAVTSGGQGGFVSRFNAGQESDCLRFTETRFLNEGGSLAVSNKFGKIVSLAFLPVQDTATGQGDLIAFCEYGAITFQVSAPRFLWKETSGFQRVLFDNIGSANENVLAVNGDIFFRSRQGNGIRTYRNARAEINSYGQTSVSAEINPILDQDTDWLLAPVSFVQFENRLLMTCWPKRDPRRASSDAQAAQFAEEPVPVVYEGIAVLDFDSVSSGRGKSAMVFDGVWTGIRPIKLVQGLFDGKSRCFAFCYHENSGVRAHEIWEITPDSEYDRQQTEGDKPVNAAIITRSFDFRDPMSLKKLIRCDLWFDDIGGGPDNKFSCELAYRPDDYPNFTRWDAFEKEFRTEFLLTDRNLLTYSEDFTNAAWTQTQVSVATDLQSNPINSQSTADRLLENTATAAHTLDTTTAPTLAGSTAYTFSVYAKAQTRDRLYLRMATGGSAFNANKEAWFYLSGPAGITSNASAGTTARIQALDDGWYRCTITATTDGAGTSDCVIGLATTAGQSSYAGGGRGLFLWGAQLEAGLSAGGYDAAPPQLTDLVRGYAPQVKFPTPSRTTNLSTDVPAYLGHDFSLRVAWTGRGRLGRLMLHGNRLVEKTGGGV
jgi:hypothetical protein